MVDLGEVSDPQYCTGNFLDIFSTFCSGQFSSAYFGNVSVCFDRYGAFLATPWKGKSCFSNKVSVEATFEASKAQFSMAFWSLENCLPYPFKATGVLQWCRSQQIVSKPELYFAMLEFNLPRSATYVLSEELAHTHTHTLHTHTLYTHREALSVCPLHSDSQVTSLP